MTRKILLIQLLWIPLGVASLVVAGRGSEETPDLAASLAGAFFYFWLVLEFPIAVASIIAIAAAVLPGEGSH